MLLESIYRVRVCAAGLLATALLFNLTGCGTETSDPVAEAGTDLLANEGAVVRLDASSSRGVNAVTYEWRQTSGPEVTLSSVTAANPVFTAPQVTRRTELTFRVFVRSNADSSRDEVRVIVNDAPVAVAGSSLVVDETSTVRLDGGLSSDSDGSISSFVWSQTSGPAVRLVNSTGFAPSFVAPDVEEAQTLVFQLTVTDNDGARSSALIEVLVRPGVLPVVIGNDVEFDPVDLTAQDLAALPTGRLSRALLVEGSRLSAIVSLGERDEIEGLARCVSLVYACVSPPDRLVDDCMRSARVCNTTPGWDEPQACCPASCFETYEAQRLNGISVPQAFLGTFYSSESCVDAARTLEDIL